MSLRTSEDYLKVIYQLEQDKSEVLVKDIASELQITAPSVIEKLGKLRDEGCLLYSKKHIKLTERGFQIAKRIIQNYTIAFNLFRTLSVSEEIASKDAHAIEHELHEETLKQLEMLLEVLKRLKIEI